MDAIHRPVKFDDPGRSQPWGLIGAGVVLIAVCYGLARFAYGLFLPAFRAEFGLDGAAAGAISSASYAAYCVAVVAATVLTPRWGARRLAVAAGVIATAGTLVIAVAPTTAVLAAGVVLAGSSTGVASPPLAHAVAHTVTATRRDRMQTVVNAGTGLGVMVAGPIALLTQDQWRAAWLVFAAGCAAVTVWVAFAVPALARTTAGRLLPAPVFPPGSVRLLVAALLTGAASSATWTFGRDLLVTEGGLGERLSAVAWIILGGCGILGAFAGSLATRVGLRRAWIATTALLAAATALLAAAPATIAVAWPAAGAFGAAYIALTGFVLIWGTRVYPHAPAAGVGLSFLTLALGQTAGAPLVGLLSESTTPRTAFFAAAAVAALGIAAGPPAPAARSRE